jgi:chorismate mutase
LDRGVTPRADDLHADVPDADARLQRLRASIDNLDAALVHLLAERFRCTQEVGELKAHAGMPPADPAREAYQIKRLRALADESGLDPHFAEKFLNLVIDEVIRNHQAIKTAVQPTAPSADQSSHQA